MVLPGALTTKEEGELEVRRTEWSATFEDYVRENCNKKGDQVSNLRKEEMEGMRSLKKRVKEGELVIMQTDKSSRFAVMKLETYEEAGMVHVRKDKEIDINYVKDNQRVLNGHCSMWLKIFKVGQNWKHEDRHRETKINKSLSDK